MNKRHFITLLREFKYIFIGEIHGTKEIPKTTFERIRPLFKNNKIVFCLEIPKQAEKELYEYLNGKTKKQQLLNSIYLNDAKNDKRISNNILIMYKNLHKAGIIFKGLEDYNDENPYERDKNIAKRFIKIIKDIDADKYIIYMGNMHLIEKSIKIGKFQVNPIKIYLPKNILRKSLTIQFYKGDKEKIVFNKKTNTINYNLALKNLENMHIYKED